MNEVIYEGDQQILSKQTYLGSKGLVGFIALMNMFIPLSTDLYLPALPNMSTYFGSSSAVTNLSLSAFFMFYALGILFWGPLSDKYGRKPILMIGSLAYMIFSIACASAMNIYFLIIARGLQGISAGGITSVSLAIIKDSFSGKKRASILAICQSISGIAPMIAPVVGALILKFSNWRGSFWVLAAIGVINLVMAILFRETLNPEEKYHGTLLGSIGRLFVVSKNKSFFIPAVIFSLSAIPFLGYISISSYIYVDYFGLNAQVYSYFFAANALLSILGPFLYVKFLCNMNKKLFATFVFVLSIISGVLVMTIGSFAPFLFLISFAIMSISTTIMRPFSTNVLFEQQKTDTGSVSSVLSTLFTGLGIVGMSIASMSWGNIVLSLGVIITVISLITLVSWLMFLKSKIPFIGVK